MNAARDGNGKPTWIGTLNSDGSTPIRIKVNASSFNSVKVIDDTVGSDNGGSSARRDGNYATTLIGVSSADGITPVCVYADSSGNLLINSS